jgi:hypothetical protein
MLNYYKRQEMRRKPVKTRCGPEIGGGKVYAELNFTVWIQQNDDCRNATEQGYQYPGQRRQTAYIWNFR